MSGTETEQVTKRRPAHETFVGAIGRARDLSQMELIAWLLQETAIPKGHSELIQALVEKKRSLELDFNETPLIGHILAQQDEAEQEAERKATEQAEKAAKPLFPPYLDQGSTGAAVNVLALMLQALGLYDPPGLFTLDGEYGALLADAVEDLQRELGFTGEEVDGNFGPATRAAFEQNSGIDVNALAVGMFTMPTVGKGPEDDAEESETS